MSCPGDVIGQAMVRLGVICRWYLLCGVMDVLVGGPPGDRPLSDPHGGFPGGGLRIAWVALIFPLYRTPAALCLSYPGTWLVTGLCHALTFLWARGRAYAKPQSRDSS